MKTIERWLLIGNIILAITTLISFTSPYIDPSSLPVISLLGLSYSAQIVLHFAFFILWMMLYLKWIWISTTFIIIELISVNGFLNLSFSTGEDSSIEMLTIGSLNMQFSKELFENGTSDRLKFSNFLKEHDDIDILCVQELGQRSRPHIDQSMTFPYQHAIEGFYVGIYSKYPVISTGTLPAEFSSANSCLWVDILYRDDTLRVYNAHLESNRYDGVVPTLINEDAEEDMSGPVYLGLLNHYVTFSEMRNDQAKALNRHRRSIFRPTIVCGDFNDVPLSRVYRNLCGGSKGLNDTFKQRGSGRGTTLKSIIPGLRIDYILITEDWTTLSHNIYKDAFSDHNLVKSTLTLSDKGKD